MNEYKVVSVMTHMVISAVPDAPLKEIVRKLHDKCATCVVIVEDKKPIGIVTERDMVRILADMLEDVIWDDLAIKYFMTSPTITLDAQMSVIDAANLARSHSIRNLPVINNAGELVGVLTLADIVSSYYQESIEAVTD